MNAPRETQIPIGPLIAAIGAVLLIVSLGLDWYGYPCARMMERYDPKAIEPKWQKVWADEHTWEVSNEPDERAKGVRARDAPVPVR